MWAEIIQSRFAAMSNIVDIPRLCVSHASSEHTHTSIVILTHQCSFNRKIPTHPPTNDECNIDQRFGAIVSRALGSPSDTELMNITSNAT